MTTQSKGIIHQINVSPKGGLPKAEVDRVMVTKKGLVGDYNAYRMTKLAGDLTSAVMLLPLDAIREFAARGYSIRPGSMGENFTLEGISYDQLSIGKRVEIGTDRVVLKIERVCNPCDELLVYGKSFPKVAQGKRGMYASVTKEGEVRKGDPVAVV